MSRRKTTFFTFNDVFERIKKNTDIKNTVQLAEIIGISQPAISNNKAKNIFPLEWAYDISKKYNLELDWLTEGKPTQGNSEKTYNQRSNDLLNEIEEWLEREKQKEPKILDWFEVEFKENFPKFAEWKRKVDREREAGLAKEQKIA